MSPDHSSAPVESEESVQRTALLDLLLTTEDIENFLQRVVEVAASVIEPQISVGVTVVRDGHPATVASSDAAAARYDEVQYGQGEGPCLMAIRTNQTVRVEDLTTDDRFGNYRAHALALGIRSALAMPLDGGKDAVGAINMYSTSPYTFDDREQAEGERFAAEASRALALAVRLTQHIQMTDQLQAALTSRTVIDQALGIIMGQNQCSAEEAFAILRTASQNRNVKLRVVAQEMVNAVNKTKSR